MAERKREKEVRCILTEIRAEGPDSRTISGIAIPYGSKTDLGYFRERIRAGAFRASLDGGDQLALYNHDMGRLLGRVLSGTLVLEDTAEGLRFSLDVPNTSDGNDVMELVRRGDLKGMSFGFYVVDEEWSPDYKEREIIEAELLEVSVVSRPAYTDTSVALRSLEEARNESRAAKVERLRQRLVIARMKNELKEEKA